MDKIDTDAFERSVLAVFGGNVQPRANVIDLQAAFAARASQPSISLAEPKAGPYDLFAANEL